MSMFNVEICLTNYFHISVYETICSCFISRQLAQAYVVATTSAVAVAVGLNSLVKVCNALFHMFLLCSKSGL